RPEQLHVAWAHIVPGDEMQQLAIETEHVCEQTSAERDRVSHDGLEDRLRVARRAADYAENLRCRRLLLERLGKPLFQLDTRFAGRVNSRSRLRSGRTTFVTVLSAFRAFARRGHLNRPPAEDQALRWLENSTQAHACVSQFTLIASADLRHCWRNLL